MRTAFAEIAAAVRDTLRITFVTPVREGRPHPSGWPRGLREVGVAAGAVFVLLALAILFAVPLRQWGDLATSPTSVDGVPEFTLPLLLTAVLLAFAMAGTAALHTSWWLRIALLVLGGSMVIFFAAQGWTNPLLLAFSAVAYLGLVGFTVARSFRGYAWWEFPVVTGLLLLATLTPWSVSATASFSIDLRPTALQGALISLQPLILPAVLVAGSAPAQLVVTGAQATAERPVGRAVFWTGFAVVVAWFAVVTFLSSGEDDLRPVAILASGVVLGLVGVVVAGLLRRSRLTSPPPPAAYPEVWGSWLYPLAAAAAAVIVLTLPVILARGILQLVGLSDAVSALNLVWFAFLDNNPGLLWRGLIGVVALGVAWRLAGRGRTAEAIALGSFGVLVVADAAGLAPPLSFLLDRSTAALGLLAAVAALVAAGVLAVSRQLDRTRAVGVLTVLLLAVLYPHRGLLADPASAVLVLTPSVLLVFGLAWRVATEAQFTYTGSRNYPQSTRVLLFLANTLFATAGVAYLALARAGGTQIDPTIWGELGDSVLGDPLFVTGLVSGLWLVLRPGTGAPSAPAHPVRAPGIVP